jgi:hypothetical protein
MKKVLLAALALCAAQAAAQSSEPQPAGTPAPAPAPERKASDARRPLNLKLDDSARSYVRETQPEAGKSADGLPTLGGSSLNFERQPRDQRPDASGKYPMDVENNRQ